MKGCKHLVDMFNQQAVRHKKKMFRNLGKFGVLQQSKGLFIEKSRLIDLSFTLPIAKLSPR